MKRFALLLIFLLLFSMLSACGTPGESTDTAPTTAAANLGPDPAEDGVLTILMVGNSFSFYFCDELYEMLTIAGINAKVYNLYYPACKLEQHYIWWKNNEAKYQLFRQDEKGRTKIEDVSLEVALGAENWDVITLQEGSSKMRRGDPEKELNTSKNYRDALYGRFAERFPRAKLYWHHTWAYQVGFNSDGYVVTPEEQKSYHQRQRQYALGVCEENGVSRIPSGDAWDLVRAGGYDDLCARTGSNNDMGDNYHDGDLGGGQYLNACVWYETLTGLDCRENTFRPEYVLAEELVVTFQNAAHQAVEAVK